MKTAFAVAWATTAALSIGASIAIAASMVYIALSSGNQGIDDDGQVV